MLEQVRISAGSHAGEYDTSSIFGQIQPWTAELPALGRLEKSPQTYNWRLILATLAPSLLIGSF